MNIKITEEQFDEYKGYLDAYYTVGSHLHKTNNEYSDTDYIFILNDKIKLDDTKVYQYSDEDGDYLICSWKKFNDAQTDGSDVVLYEAFQGAGTKKIIKAYLGLAKRDLKEYEQTHMPKKLYHALRCLYTANSLIYSGMSEIRRNAKLAQRDITIFSVETIKNMINDTRKLFIATGKHD